MIETCRYRAEHDLHLAAKQVDKCGPETVIGHVRHIHAGHHFEHLAGYMDGASDAGGRVTHLAWVGLGISYELRNRLCRNGRMHQHDKGRADDSNDGNIADEIEIELVVQRRIDCGGCVGLQKRISVSSSAHDCLGGDIAGCACPVLDDEWLAEPLG